MMLNVENIEFSIRVSDEQICFIMILTEYIFKPA